jgi:subtilisin family serine protease
MEQRTIVEAMTRALNYAYRKGLTSVAALGNQHTDLGAPQPDATSPDYPAASTHNRVIDNARCLSLLVEGPHTIGVSAFGPSGAEADYSNYGTEQISVSAPGGYFRDGFGTDWYRTKENMILLSYPRNVGVAEGNIDADGNVTPDGVALGVQKAVSPDGRVGYYQYLQGTSMATPHATGVAALIVSKYGEASQGGFGLSPDAVQRVIEGTAAPIACRCRTRSTTSTKAVTTRSPRPVPELRTPGRLRVGDLLRAPGAVTPGCRPVASASGSPVQLVLQHKIAVRQLHGPVLGEAELLLNLVQEQRRLSSIDCDDLGLNE